MADENPNPNPNPTPAPAAPALSGIAARVDAILTEHHSHLAPEQRAMVVSLAQAQRWGGEISERLDAAVSAFGPAVSYTPGRGRAPAAPARAFDPGAPSGAPAAGIPLDPLQLNQSTVDAMTPAQAKDWYDRYVSTGRPTHPFKRAREEEARNRSGELANEISRAIADQLGKLR